MRLVVALASNVALDRMRTPKYARKYAPHYTNLRSACFWRGNLVIFRRFLKRETVIFDFVLHSLEDGGHRAEADRVIRGGQNLAEAVHHGGGTRSREVPKGSRHATHPA